MIMDLPGRWIAFIASVVLLVVAPYLPAGFPGLSVLGGAVLLFVISREISLPLALGIIGLLGITGILPVFVLCASVLIVATKELIFHYAGGKPVEYALTLIGGLLMAAVVMEYLGTTSWLSAVVGATVAVLLHSIMGTSRQAVTGELIGVAMVMLLIEDLEYQASFPLVLTAAIIAFSFSYLAYRAKTADIPGLFSAALMGILLIVFTGIPGFLVMLSFFIIGSAATRYKMDYKKSLHVEQEGGGVRGYVNVFANGLVSCGAAVCWGITREPACMAVYVGSVATAAADTVAGEIGVTSGRPYLITTLKPVPEGTNGGVSPLGEIAGLFAAIFVAACAVLLGLADLSIFAAAIVGGFIGGNIDSLIGDLLENRKYIGNAGTNLLATLGGGVVAGIIWVIITPLFNGFL